VNKVKSKKTSKNKFYNFGNSLYLNNDNTKSAIIQLLKIYVLLRRQKIKFFHKLIVYSKYVILIKIP